MDRQRSYEETYLGIFHGILSLSLSCTYSPGSLLPAFKVILCPSAEGSLVLSLVHNTVLGGKSVFHIHLLIRGGGDK